MSGGRPRKVTDEQRQQALDLVRAGATRAQAAAAVGVGKTTVDRFVAEHERQHPDDLMPRRPAPPRQRTRADAEAERQARHDLLAEDIAWMVDTGDTDVTAISNRLITHPLTPTQVARFAYDHLPEHFPRLTGIATTRRTP